MRILWITPGFAAGEQDTNCIPPLQLLARELLRRGVDLRIIALEYPYKTVPYGYPELVSPTLRPSDPTPDPSPEGEGRRGAAIPSTSPLPFRGGVGGGVGGAGSGVSAGVYPCNGRNRRWLRWRTLARARRLARQLSAEKPFDAIHSFWLGPAWSLGEQLSLQWQTPHLSTLMGQDVLPENRYLKRLTPAGAERLVALTPFHNAMLEKTTGLRAAHCIPWGVAREDIPAALPACRPVDVAGVGSLIPVKNWERWLQVLQIVAGKRPHLRAELIGSGPRENRLRTLVRQLGLEQQVHFTGELPRPAVLARLRESKVLLHTARFESFGMVLAEAAANGCRVVSTPVGAAPELGLCAGNDAELADAVLQGVEAPLLQIPAAPLRIETCADRYMEWYAQNLK
ncbi:MAG: glycosyltransferase [Thermoanaerobaculia bacterium]|nr:glycosyltransferase [Thermoanaerobaculia bacterium]